MQHHALPARRLRRSLVAVVLAAATLATVGVMPATADPVRGGCPPGRGTTWALTGPAAWTVRSAAGLVAEFGSLDAAAVALIGEAATSADVIALVEESFRIIDANRDGSICVSGNNPRGIPDYYFQVADNKFRLAS